MASGTVDHGDWTVVAGEGGSDLIAVVLRDEFDVAVVDFTPDQAREFIEAIHFAIVDVEGTDGDA